MLVLRFRRSRSLPRAGVPHHTCMIASQDSSVYSKSCRADGTQMARHVKLLVLFTGVDGGITLGCAMYAMAVSSAHFDNPELQSTFIAEAAGVTANVLMFPARLIWTPWASKNLPNFLEWLLFVGNSALW